jgi:hypothetical protein
LIRSLRSHNLFKTSTIFADSSLKPISTEEERKKELPSGFEVSSQAHRQRPQTIPRSSERPKEAMNLMLNDDTDRISVSPRKSDAAIIENNPIPVPEESLHTFASELHTLTS